MEYLIVYENTIDNIILCDSDEIAESLGAVPSYPGAEIGSPYLPPKPYEPSEYIPTPEQSAVFMMRSTFATQTATMEDEEIIKCSGLANDWAPGNHTVGEIFNTRSGGELGEEWDQTWEVFQEYDNDVFADIKPGDPSWYTFNRPLHGKSPETARPFVQVQGAHDMYRAGEYAVWTDGKTYRCKSDTNFSPDDYPDAWEVITGN